MRHKGKGQDSIFVGQVQSPPQSLLLLQILIPYKKHPEECAWSDYCNNFGKSDSNFLQSNKFTACKVRHGKEVAKSLLAFNLRMIIHPFQSKNHLRSQ